jgi:hypothetical protein
MRHTSCVLLLGLLLAAPGVARAADEPAGNWKLSLSLQGQNRTLWLLRLQQAGGKWEGKVIAKAESAMDAGVQDVSVADGLLRFRLKVQASLLDFEGRLPKEPGKPIYGSFDIRGQVVVAELEPTTLTSFDRFEVAREELAKAASPPQALNSAMTLLGEAAAKKVKPEEVRRWAERAYKAAEAYGPRQQREVALDIADTLTAQEGYGETALAFARRAERALGPKEAGGTQTRVLRALAAALKKAGKDAEAREVEGRLAKLQALTVTPYAGRKGKGDRVALVELFTGAQCPPCVAADLAFDALQKTYKPADVVLLQYHEHIPGPDPLTNPDSEARLKYYGMDVRGTPTALFNGRPEAPGGGSREDAREKYQEYREVLDALLEGPAAKVKLTATAVRKGSKVEVGAEASAAEDLGERVRLRLALVEDRVGYTGTNKVAEHHNVVRDFPGGTAGVALKGKGGKHAATVDLDELRKKLTKYLDDFAKENDAFPGKVPAIELKKLRLVAFVQNDQTKEVLQAVQVDVKDEAK